MEWRPLLKKINDLKESGDPFISQLCLLEKASAEANDQIFIDTLLSLDYEFYDEIQKAELYARKAISEIEAYVENTVLGPGELVYLVDLLEKCYLNLLRHGLAEPEEIYRGPLIDRIRLFGSQVFFHFLSKGGEWFGNILLAVKFMNVRLVDHLRELFESIFSFYDPSFLEETVEAVHSAYAEHLAPRKSSESRTSEIYVELVINLLVLEDESYDSYMESARNILISRKNNLEDLHRIFLNCLKIGKYETIGKVLRSFLKCKEILTGSETSVLKGLLTEYSKIDHSLSYNWINFIDTEDFLRFLFKKRMYSRIVEIYERSGLAPLDYAFCSYIELGRVDKAQKLFEIEQASKYGLDSSYDRTPLPEEYVLRLHLRTGNHPAVCNILQATSTVEMFTELVQIIYSENKLKLLVEAVYIGLERFRTSDFRMMQIFISLLHIERLDILAFDRADMVLKMVRALDIGSLSEKQREWVRSVCFNNVLDLVDLRYKEITGLADTIVLLGPDVDSVYLCLCVYSREDVNTSEHREEIAMLRSCIEQIDNAEASENYYCALILFYKCYCILEDGAAEDTFNLLLPFKKLSDRAVSLLLHLESETINKLFDRKVSVMKEGERRSLLSCDVVYAFISNLSIQGPHASLLLLEKLVLYVETKYLRDPRIVQIATNQRSLLEMVGDKRSAGRVSLILEKIGSAS